MGKRIYDKEILENLLASVCGRITDLEFNIIYKMFTGKDTMRLDGKYDRRNLFADIDPRKVREHINNTIQSNTIQFQNIMAFKREGY